MKRRLSAWRFFWLNLLKPRFRVNRRLDRGIRPWIQEQFRVGHLR